MLSLGYESHARRSTVYSGGRSECAAVPQVAPVPESCPTTAGFHEPQAPEDRGPRPSAGLERLH
eukprot:6942118-Alexandrium_andersonii.AAC.1